MDLVFLSRACTVHCVLSQAMGYRFHQFDLTSDLRECSPCSLLCFLLPFRSTDTSCGHDQTKSKIDSRKSTRVPAVSHRIVQCVQFTGACTLVWRHAALPPLSLHVHDGYGLRIHNKPTPRPVRPRDRSCWRGHVAQHCVSVHRSGGGVWTRSVRSLHHLQCAELPPG